MQQQSQRNFVEQDKSLLLNTRFAAPPEDVEPSRCRSHFGTFDDVPLPMKRHRPPRARRRRSHRGIATAFPPQDRRGSVADRAARDTTPDIAPVHEISAPVTRSSPDLGLHQSTEDLRGRLRRESSSEAERFTLKGDVFFDIDRPRSRRKRRRNLARSPGCARWRSRISNGRAY